MAGWQSGPRIISGTFAISRWWRRSSSRSVQHDACYLPRAAHVTGDIRVHEIAFGTDDLWIVNTRFSCLCTLDRDHNFVPHSAAAVHHDARAGGSLPSQRARHARRSAASSDVSRPDRLPGRLACKTRPAAVVCSNIASGKVAVAGLVHAALAALV